MFRKMSRGGNNKKLGDDIITDIAARTNLSREEVTAESRGRLPSLTNVEPEITCHDL
jgi:hypothetical protein